MSDETSNPFCPVHGEMDQYNVLANTVGPRPLLAKTCLDCGLLFNSEEFTRITFRNGRGYWRSMCKLCDSARKRKTKRNFDHGTNQRQRRTVATAQRVGLPWTEWEYAILRDTTLTAEEKAFKLNRTLYSVYNRLRILGISETRYFLPDNSGGAWQIRFKGRT